MSSRDPHDTPAEPTDEPFLGRWSRLKTQARQREADDEVTAAPPASTTALPAPADTAPAAEPAQPLQLPDLDLLDQDSDYSAFLAQGVDAGLRKRALRKLFHSPKFNVFDGLDTYRDDFTSFPPLGDIVTADMRHQLERAARELAARAEAALSREGPAAEIPPPAVADESLQQPLPPAVAHPPLQAPADLPTERNENDAEHGPA